MVPVMAVCPQYCIWLTDLDDRRGPEVEAEARALNPELGEDRFSPVTDLEIAQLRDASGPFLRVEQQNGSGEYFVNLQDATRVWDFCVNTSHEADDQSHDGNHICARCKSDLQESKTLSLSEKDGHLDLALLCLRAMNNPVFQRQSTADDEVPQWSRNVEETVQTEEGGAKITGEDTADAPLPNPEETADDRKEAPADTETSLSKGVSDDEKANDETSDDVAGTDAPADDSGYESEMSADDEDRGEVNFAPPVEKKDETPAPYVEEVRKGRYENIYWTEHLRRAEELWTPEERAKDSRWAEVMSELDHFTSYNPSFFYAWQRFPNIDNSPAYHTALKPLHLAAVYGLISWAKHLLATGADVNERAGLPYAKTPLQMTAWHGDNVPLLRLFLEHGGDPNLGDENTFPAFHEWLYENSSKEVIELFLQFGANTTMVNDIGRWTAVHYFASRATDVEALDLLLQETPEGKKPDINYSENSSPLHILLRRREVPKALLQVATYCSCCWMMAC